MDVSLLTQTELFRKSTDGENENQHITYKDFVFQVSEVRILLQYKPLSVEYLN